ncbi:MAG: efflux RND transporter permease subunit [Acidobacteriota bacterium]
MPLGIFGALLAVYLRAYPYDIYTQIGIVTLIGLSAKNAILIVEFARDKMLEGLPVREAALEAAHLRLRPILMTSFAFVLGVLPLCWPPAQVRARAGPWEPRCSAVCWRRRCCRSSCPVLFVVIESFAQRRRKVAPAVQPSPETA